MEQKLVTLGERRVRVNENPSESDYVNDIKVPLPSLEEQQTIVKAIEEELQLVNASKRLIEIFEQKIKTKIGEVWGLRGNV